MTDSQKLLAEYARTGSDAAFRELVTRYVDLVYSTALRLVGGDGHRAQDVTQIVFTNLARKAGSLSTNLLLGGWLHRHTCYVASTMMRTERRRQVREQQASQVNMSDHTEENLGRIAPILDEAINELCAEDREAIVLRFFEQEDLRSVGHALGSSEDAARMRITRALEKLASLLKHRGVAFSSATLGTALATEAVSAAPAGLAAAVVSTAFAGTAMSSGIVGLTTMKIGILSAIAVTGVVAITLQYISHVSLRQENQLLSRQLAGLSELRLENERLSNLLASANGAALSSKQDFSELLRLRGEIGQLRQANKDLYKAQNQATSAVSSLYVVSGAGIAGPNRFPFRAGTTVSSAIRAAQGFTTSADKKHIELRRGEKERAILDFTAIEQGTAADPELSAGDMLFVPGLPTKMTTVDLGTIELTAHTPKRLSLGAGRDCILTGAQVSDGSIEVKMSVEASDHSEQFGEYRITTQSGRVVGVGVGETIVQFAPILAKDGTEVHSETAGSTVLYVRDFKLDASALLQQIKNSSRGPESTQEGLVRFLKEQGVDTFTPAAAFLDESKGDLLVRNTLTNIEKIESILARVQDKR